MFADIFVFVGLVAIGVTILAAGRKL